jgi:CheY-like chemotaxis protein
MPVNPADALPGDGRINILAVDDNAGKLVALTAILADLNQNVLTASSGREALRLLLQREFAVVLLDVHMPGMDGFEAAALIRQRESSEHTPIIFVTSYPDDTHAARGYSLGAVDYILAPVDPDVLKTKVTVFVELFKKTAEIKAQAKALEHRATQLQRLTQASLAINSALSPGQTLQVVANFARDILGVHQAVAVAAPDEKWTTARSAAALSPGYESLGERPVLRDRESLVSLLSTMGGPVRRPRDAETSEYDRYHAVDRPGRVGWLATPLTGRDGRPMGLLHVLDKCDGEFREEDASVLTQLAQMSSIAIENAVNAEAREANRMKDEFLTTLSHELRTPLAAILGWTRLLRSGRLDPERTSGALEVIERNVLAQTKLIDDLLDVSRIITGKLRLSVQPCTLSAVIRAAMDSMRPAAEGKQIEMRLENQVAADKDLIFGDPDRLQQITWNLISNSIKFTPPRGRVTVELSRNDQEFEVAVSDSGQGMSPEFLAHAFDRFRQADSSTTRSHGGLGIGLAIARHLTELHGGSIAAESAGPGQGSRFRVLLPSVALGIERVVRREPEALASPVGREHGSLAGIKVLLVEDQWDSRDLMAEILRSAGCEVVATGSVPEAMDALLSAHPDIVVSDIGMPGEDGYALLRRIRQGADDFRAIPALAVSAYAREEDRIRSLSAGFHMHLAKPFEPEDLTAAVSRLVHRETPSREEDAGKPRPQILVIEDNGDVREGLRQLLESSGYVVEVAEDGVRGLERAITRRPRIALVDLGLPGLDGYAVAERIRRALPREEMALVALTGRTDPDDLHRVVSSGFDDYLAKPVSYDKLDAMMSARLAVAPRSPLND